MTKAFYANKFIINNYYIIEKKNFFEEFGTRTEYGPSPVKLKVCINS